jgi:acid phosphatase family membrane protein YuiD
LLCEWEFAALLCEWEFIVPRASEISALKVADEAFLVKSMIDRCPKTMMIRELFMNSMEAAMAAPKSSQMIEIKAKQYAGVRKLCLWNTGPGMSSFELYEICDLASSLGKEKGLDKNFGMGAKVASLPSNQLGIRYRSCKAGEVNEVIIGCIGGVYGRIRRVHPESGRLEEVFDVTDACRTEGDYDLSFDWIEVLLLGNKLDQDTVRDPYDGNPIVPGQWLADYLYHRFFRLPSGLSVRFLEGTHKLDGARTFKSLSRSNGFMTLRFLELPSAHGKFRST